MRLFACLLSASLLLPLAAIAGDKEEDHENWMQQVDEVEVDDLAIRLSGAHAQETFVLVKMKATNNSDDYFLFQPSDSVFEGDFGSKQLNDGKPKKKKLVKPRGSVSQTFKVKGDGGMHVDGFTLNLDGFSRVPADGKALKADPFVFPVARNKFEAGPFKCSLTDSKLTTDVSSMKFQCTYKGEGIGWIDPPEMGIEMQDGGKYANSDKKAKRQLVEPGASAKFTAVFKLAHRKGDADIQFDKFLLHFFDTFSESMPTDIDAEEIEFELDEALTAEKNE
jgi:hypothetical protein